VQYEARSFDVDSLKCLGCGVPMVVLAFLTDPPVVSKILAQGIPTTPPPLTPARLAAQEELFPDAADEASQDPDDHLRSPETGSARGPP